MINCVNFPHLTRLDLDNKLKEPPKKPKASLEAYGQETKPAGGFIGNDDIYEIGIGCYRYSSKTLHCDTPRR
jgi:hypothetical protein